MVFLNRIVAILLFWSSLAPAMAMEQPLINSAQVLGSIPTKTLQECGTFVQFSENNGTSLKAQPGYPIHQATGIVLDIGAPVGPLEWTGKFCEGTTGRNPWKRAPEKIKIEAVLRTMNRAASLYMPSARLESPSSYLTHSEAIFRDFKIYFPRVTSVVIHNSQAPFDLNYLGELCNAKALLLKEGLTLSLLDPNGDKEKVKR